MGLLQVAPPSLLTMQLPQLFYQIYLVLQWANLRSSGSDYLSPRTQAAITCGLISMQEEGVYIPRTWSQAEGMKKKM